MKNPQQSIIVKDDGHIDPKVWFGRYGIKYKIAKKIQQNKSKESSENVSGNGTNRPLLKIRTSSEGMRRWRLGIEQSKKQGTKGWKTLELRLYIMKHGSADGFQFKNFDDYDRIVAYYS